MSMTTLEHEHDEENPSTSSRTVLGVFKDPDPGFSQTFISIATNFVLSNMFVYGFTGRSRLAFLVSMSTIPVSTIICVRDSKQDYERWKELKVLRLKGVPDRFLPYKCKYDWTDYEKRMERPVDVPNSV